MSSTPVAAPTRVLLAEDEGLIAALTRSELHATGFTVVGTAPDGRRAVELVRELQPDVVVMDIAMPELDGIAAALEIQKECPTPVVILSAHTEPEQLARATAAGVGAFVVKPPRGDELARAITIAIARHADLMALRSLNTRLQAALAAVRSLEGLLPICCDCKRIRDSDGAWSEIDSYIARHTDAHFSHGFCPRCFAVRYPDIDLSDPSH